MNLIVKPPTALSLEIVREWRNEDLSSLRTPFFLTEEMQEDYYKQLCDQKSNKRMWCFYENYDPAYKCKNEMENLIAFGGLENIEWENRLAEISIIVDWQYRTQGYGKEAVAKILEQGFDYFNLENIYGECYKTNPDALAFWEKIMKIHSGYKTMLPQRKYWHGSYHDSLYFNINKAKWAKCES